MGFHWGFLAIKSDGPGIAKTVMGSLGYPIDACFDDLGTLEGHELFHKIASSGQKRSAVPKEGLAYLITTLDGWTFIESSRGIFYCEVSKVSSAVGADVCLAWADSTTWSIGMEYATADGARRSREFKLDAELITSGRSAIAKRPLKDGNGRIFGYEIVPSILIGKDGQLLPSSMFGKEHAGGAVLPGEPTELQIMDDESLITLLVSLKVPIGAVLNRWHCSVPDILLRGDSSVLKMSGMYNDGRRREICVEMALRNNGRSDDRCQVLISGPLVISKKTKRPKHRMFSLFTK